VSLIAALLPLKAEICMASVTALTIVNVPIVLVPPPDAVAVGVNDDVVVLRFPAVYSTRTW
jgi:hypothetical protein